MKTITASKSSPGHFHVKLQSLLFHKVIKQFVQEQVRIKLGELIVLKTINIKCGGITSDEQKQVDSKDLKLKEPCLAFNLNLKHS